jgi:hypothetical protein
MKKIRKAMWAVTRKGRLVRNSYGLYIMFDKKTDAQNFALPDLGILKVTITIQPTEGLQR